MKASGLTFVLLAEVFIRPLLLFFYIPPLSILPFPGFLLRMEGSVASRVLLALPLLLVVPLRVSVFPALAVSVAVAVSVSRLRLLCQD